MANTIFFSEEFDNLTFKSKDPVILNTEFLLQWNNIECRYYGKQ